MLIHNSQNSGEGVPQLCTDGAVFSPDGEDGHVWYNEGWMFSRTGVCPTVHHIIYGTYQLLLLTESQVSETATQEVDTGVGWVVTHTGGHSAITVCGSASPVQNCSARSTVSVYVVVLLVSSKQSANCSCCLSLRVSRRSWNKPESAAQMARVLQQAVFLLVFSAICMHAYQ